MTLQGYVTTEINYSNTHARHEVLAWLLATFVLLYKLHLKSPGSWGGVIVML